jgi:hypothetical protein
MTRDLVADDNSGRIDRRDLLQGGSERLGAAAQQGARQAFSPFQRMGRDWRGPAQGCEQTIRLFRAGAKKIDLRPARAYSHETDAFDNAPVFFYSAPGRLTEESLAALIVCD